MEMYRGKLRKKRPLLRIVFGIIVLGLILAGCTPMLIHESQWPDFTPPVKKSMCVVIRRLSKWSGGSDRFTPIFLDTEYVGGTEGNTVFSFSALPGKHFIVADASNKSHVRFNFRAGKIYYILQTVVAIPYAGEFSTFTPITGSDAEKILQDEKGSSTWVYANPSKPHDNLSQEDMADICKDYNEWSVKAENANSYKSENDYPGY